MTLEDGSYGEHVTMQELKGHLDARFLNTEQMMELIEDVVKRGISHGSKWESYMTKVEEISIPRDEAKKQILGRILMAL